VIASISIGKCGACGAFHGGAASVCPHCHSADLSEHQTDGNGTLLTWTIIHRPPKELLGISPYAVGVVRLTEGVHVVGRLNASELNRDDDVACISIESGVPVFAVTRRHARSAG